MEYGFAQSLVRDFMCLHRQFFDDLTRIKSHGQDPLILTYHEEKEYLGHGSFPLGLSPYDDVATECDSVEVISNGVADTFDELATS